MKNVVLLSLLYLTLFAGSALAENKFVVDAIVASVDGEPITLSDVAEVLGDKQKLTLEQASSDPEVRIVVDQIILDHLIQAEAKARNLGVSDGEIERYIEEVSNRNGIERSDFENILKKEGKSLEDYKEQVRVDILKSKIASGFMQSGVAVTDQEVEEYIENIPNLNKSGAKVKLSQIFVSISERPETEARAIIEKAQTQLMEGSSFSSVAKKYSESSEAANGGSLGVIAEEDLGETIFDALYGLEDDEISDIVQSDNGFHIFKLEERFVQSDDEEAVDDSLKSEVRAQLKKRKVDERMHEFFTLELMKLHAVDKKI